MGKTKLAVVLFTLMVLTLSGIAFAGYPDPGHPASQIGGDNESERTFYSPELYYFLGMLSVQGSIFGAVDIARWNSLGNQSGIGVFVGVTNSSYGGNIGGYNAANAICNNEFAGSHFCSQEEIISTINQKNISEIPAWTGDVWVKAGGPKYAPAPVPANDCNGWTDGSANFIGNFWSFDMNIGGIGKATLCNGNFKLACCE